MPVQMMDDRFMLNQEPIKDAVGAICQAKAVVYTTMGATESRRKYGVTGQSIVKTLPQAVWVDGLGMHNVDTNELVPVLLQAVKELNERVRALEGAKRKTKTVKAEVPEVPEVPEVAEDSVVAA